MDTITSNASAIEPRLTQSWKHTIETITLLSKKSLSRSGDRFFDPCYRSPSLEENIKHFSKNTSHLKLPKQLLVGRVFL